MYICICIYIYIYAYVHIYNYIYLYIHLFIRKVQGSSQGWGIIPDQSDETRQGTTDMGFTWAIRAITLKTVYLQQFAVYT